MSTSIFQEFAQPAPPLDPLAEAYEAGRRDGYDEGLNQAQAAFENELGTLRAASKSEIEGFAHECDAHVKKLAGYLQQIGEHLGQTHITQEVNNKIEVALTTAHAPVSVQIETSPQIETLLRAGFNDPQVAEFSPSDNGYTILKIDTQSIAFNHSMLEEHIRHLLNSALHSGDPA